MKRPYEIPVVFRVNNNDEEFQQAVDQVIAWIQNSAETNTDGVGQVTRIDRNTFGRRRLAYEIDSQRDGFYILFYANVEPTHLAEFETNMRLYDPVLRYLVFRDEDASDNAAEETAETPAEETAEAPAEETAEAPAEETVEASAEVAAEEETTEEDE